MKPSEIFEGENSSLKKVFDNTTHEKEDCPCPYSTEPKWISRATWICPECKRDVSLEYVILQDVKQGNNLSINKD